MATENIQITLKLNDDGASAQLKNFKGEIVASKIPIADLRKEFGNFVLHAKQSERTLKTTRQSFDNLGKSIGGFKTATGAASASALELGRVVSDMPYGIRGVANNISQFASMMAMSSRATDAATGKIIGLSGAFKGLWASLMGPLGILLAIQAVISGLDYFYGGMKKAEDGSKDLRYSTVELESTMSKLYLTQKDVNKKIDEYIDLIIKKREVAKAEAEFQKELTDVDKKLAEARIKASKSVMSQKEKELSSPKAIANVEKAHKKATDEIDRLEKKRVKIIKESLARQKEIRDAQKEFDAAEEGTVKALQDRKAALEKEQKTVSKTAQKWKEYQKEIDSVQKSIEKITGKKTKQKEKFILKDPKDFDKELKTLEEETIKYYKKSLVQQTENGLDKLKAEKKNEQDRLLLLKTANEEKFREQAEAAKKDYDTYLKLQVAKGKITEVERQKKQMAFNDKVDADVESQMESSKKAYKNALNALDYLYEELFKKQKEKQEADDKKSDLKKWKDKLDAMRDYAAKAKEILSSVTGFINGEFDREIAIEKNRTNAINNELNQRLLNEKLSKDERRSIQNQIAKNDELLRQKQEKIEKRRFEMNKAANIAGATIDTFRAAAGVLKDTKGGSFARIAGMIAVIGAGLAQVTAISRQKFVSSAGARTPVRGGGGGSSNGGNDRSFNFNLVGNTQANQIADAIQGRFKQPLKAFVVSRDITTQQELDANIKGSASF